MITEILYATWKYTNTAKKWDHVWIMIQTGLKILLHNLKATNINQHCQLSQDTCDHHPFFALVCLTNPGIHGSKFITISKALRAPCWEEVQATHHLQCHRFEQCARPQTLSLSIVRWHETTRLSLPDTSFEFMRGMSDESDVLLHLSFAWSKYLLLFTVR